MLSLLGLGGGSGGGAHEAGAVWAERPPPAPADLLLGEGEIELATALRQGGAAEVCVQLTQPVAELLRQRMLAERLTSLFSPWATAAAAAEAHELVPAGSLVGADVDADADADVDADADADADADGAGRAAGWARKVLAAVQADLVAVQVPAGEARLRLALFEWDERSLHVAQQVRVRGWGRGRGRGRVRVRVRVRVRLRLRLRLRVKVRVRVMVRVTKKMSLKRSDSGSTGGTK